jgi:hypothetical protein
LFWLAVLPSDLNSLAIVTWEDFISLIPQFRSFTDRRQLVIIKFIGKSSLFYHQSSKISEFLLQDSVISRVDLHLPIH